MGMRMGERAGVTGLGEGSAEVADDKYNAGSATGMGGSVDVLFHWVRVCMSCLCSSGVTTSV